MYRYNLRSTINVQFFFGFCRKLARTKTQQGTDKASEHNWHTVFSQDLVLHGHLQERCQLCLIIIYPLFITLPHNLLQTSLFASASVTNRVLCPLGLGRHAKAYDHVALQPPIEVDTTMTMYPVAADLSDNHRASGNVSTSGDIRPYPCHQRRLRRPHPEEA